MLLDPAAINELVDSADPSIAAAGQVGSQVKIRVAGAWLIAKFHWILYVFGAFLLITGIKMWWFAETKPDLANNPMINWIKGHMKMTNTLEGERFFVFREEAGKIVRFATPLFLVLILVEISDLIFAVDSIPAIFAITTDPFIVYTSNIFAILGLRALYFALAAMVHRFHYLKYALSVLLVFIGSKIFVGDLLGFEGGKFPASLSLGITVGILAAGVGWSLWKTRNDPPVESTT